MASTIKIAVIQLYARPMQVESNFTKAVEFIRRAASEGAQLAVLPEYHLTSWVPEDAEFVERSKSSEQYLGKYQALARECNICIVPGTILRQVEDERESAESSNAKVSLMNETHFIANDGTILGSYKKKNLWSTERHHLTSGGTSPHEVIQTPLGPVGLLICWDLAFPEAFRELIAQGAKIIIIPSFWTLLDCTPEGRARNPLAEQVFLDSTLTARTFENTCAVVFSNAGGPAERGYAGLSQVTAPFVGPIGRLGKSAEEMLLVDLDLNMLEEAEDNYQVRADISREGWHYHPDEKAKHPKRQELNGKPLYKL